MAGVATCGYDERRAPYQIWLEEAGSCTLVVVILAACVYAWQAGILAHLLRVCVVSSSVGPLSNHLCRPIGPISSLLPT